MGLYFAFLVFVTACRICDVKAECFPIFE